MPFAPVRTPQQQGGAFTPRATSGAQVNPAAYSGGAGLVAAGQALGKASQQIEAVYDKEADQLARADSAGALTAYTDWSRQQRMAATEAQGKDAEGIGGRFATEATAKAAEIRATLSPRAQQTFDLQVRAQMGSDQNYFAEHETRQKQVYMDAQSAARIGSLNEEIALAWRTWRSPDDMGKEMGGHMLSIRNEVAAIGQRKGWDADTLNYQTQKAENDALKGVILRAVKEDPIKARQMFESNRGVFDSATAYTLDGATKESAEKEVVARDGAAAWEQAGRPVFSGGGPSENYNSRLLVAEGTTANTKSTATGPGQFLKKTWLDAVRRHRPDVAEGKTDEEILALRTENPALAQEMATAFTEENRQALQAAGLPINDGTLYLAHFLGASGAMRVLKADPSTPITEVTSSAAQDSNPDVFAQLSTAADMVAWAEKKIGAAPSDGQPPGPPLSPEAQYMRVVKANQQRYERGEISADMLARLNTDAKTRKTAQADAEKAQVEALQKDAYRHIAAGGTLDDWFRANPLARQTLGAKLKALEEYADKKGKVTTDPATLQDLRMKAVTNPVEFANIDMLDYKAKLSASDFDAMVKLKADIVKGARTPEYGQVTAVSDAMAKEFGWDKSDSTQARAAKYQLTSMAWALADQAAGTGVPLTRSEIRARLAPAALEIRATIGSEVGAPTVDYSVGDAVTKEMIDEAGWEISGKASSDEDKTRIAAVRDRAAQIAEEASAKGIALTRSEWRAKLQPMFGEFDGGGVGADIQAKYGNPDLIALQEIDKPEDGEVTDIAREIGLPRGVVQLAVDYLYAADADYSRAAIEAAAPKAAAEAVGVPKSYAEAWFAQQQKMGNPVVIEDMRAAYDDFINEQALKYGPAAYDGLMRADAVPRSEIAADATMSRASPEIRVGGLSLPVDPADRPFRSGSAPPPQGLDTARRLAAGAFGGSWGIGSTTIHLRGGDDPVSKALKAAGIGEVTRQGLAIKEADEARAIKVITPIIIGWGRDAGVDDRLLDPGDLMVSETDPLWPILSEVVDMTQRDTARGPVWVLSERKKVSAIAALVGGDHD